MFFNKSMLPEFSLSINEGRLCSFLLNPISENLCNCKKQLKIVYYCRQRTVLHSNNFLIKICPHNFQSQKPVIENVILCRLANLPNIKNCQHMCPSRVVKNML